MLYICRHTELKASPNNRPFQIDVRCGENVCANSSRNMAALLIHTFIHIFIIGRYGYISMYPIYLQFNEYPPSDKTHIVIQTHNKSESK